MELIWTEKTVGKGQAIQAQVNERVQLYIDNFDREDSKEHPWRYELLVKQTVNNWQSINFGHAASLEEAKVLALALYNSYLKVWLGYKRKELMATLADLDKIEGREQLIQIDPDDEMSITLSKRGSYWVTANNVSIAIILGELGLEVKAYPKGYEMNDELADLTVWYEEAEWAIKEEEQNSVAN